MEPLPPLLPDQEFFNMGEACRIVQIPDYTLRYWESKLRLLRPVRRESGHRRYTQKNIKTLLRIKELVQNRHMSLAGARQVLNREQRGPAAGTLAATANGTANGTKNFQENLPLAKVLKELRSELKSLLAELSD